MLKNDNILTKTESYAVDLFVIFIAILGFILKCVLVVFFVFSLYKLWIISSDLGYLVEIAKEIEIKTWGGKL